MPLRVAVFFSSLITNRVDYCHPALQDTSISSADMIQEGVHCRAVRNSRAGRVGFLQKPEGNLSLRYQMCE